MKTILFFLVIIALSPTAKGNDFFHYKHPVFPEWNISMIKGYSGCSCTGAFVSCEKTCPTTHECTCRCGLFNCSCTDCSPLAEAFWNGKKYFESNSPVFVSNIQYKNWKTLYDLLCQSVDAQQQKLPEKLLELFNLLKNKEFAVYKIASRDLMTNLQGLPNPTKTHINKVLNIELSMI